MISLWMGFSFQPLSISSFASQSSSSGCVGLLALDAEVARRGDDAAAEVVLPQPVDDHPGQQPAGAVVHVGDPVRQRPPAVRRAPAGRRRRPASASPRPGRSASALAGSSASPRRPSGWGRRASGSASAPGSRRPACGSGSPARPRCRSSPSPSPTSAPSARAPRPACSVPAIPDRWCDTSAAAPPARRPSACASGRRPAPPARPGRPPAAASPSRPTGRGGRRHRQPRPADVVAGVVVELQRECQQRAAVEADVGHPSRRRRRGPCRTADRPPSRTSCRRRWPPRPAGPSARTSPSG